MFSPLSDAWWSRASPAEPVTGSHEPPVQHPRGPESGEPAAGEEPASPESDPRSDTLPPTGPAKAQLQPRVSQSELTKTACLSVISHRVIINL